MRALLIIILVGSQFVLTACKEEEVSFNPTPETPFEIEPPEELEVRGPVVRILKAPVDQLITEDNEVIFEVIKGDNDIEDVDCSINSLRIPCDWVQGLLKIVGMDVGEHLFQVVATDVEGLKGQDGEFWKVYDRFQRKKETISVDGENQSDILFVVDNSSSMGAEQLKMSQRFDKFIDQVDDINWHIGITTTDLRTNNTWGDGQLSQFSNGDYFLKSTLDKTTAQTLFAESIRRSEKGSTDEKGIQATYRSIERSMDPRDESDDRLTEFFRPNAALAVVVVSDENETGFDYKSKGSNLIELVKEKWGATKLFQFNSIIVHTRECYNGAGAYWGYAYEALSARTNGILGDICADNYSELLSDIGKSVAGLQRNYSLECVPQDIDKDGTVDFVVTPKNGKAVPGYTLNKDRIEFDKGLKSGEYDFHYFCLN